MANTYVWQFERLDVFPTYNGLTNVVQSVHWRINASDGAGHNSTSYGEQTIGPPDPQNFTPFASLTEAQVRGWVEALMGSDLDGVMSDLDRGIAEQVTPQVIGMNPPWV